MFKNVGEDEYRMIGKKCIRESCGFLFVCHCKSSTHAAHGGMSSCSSPHFETCSDLDGAMLENQ
jgi:hypothetical protein